MKTLSDSDAAVERFAHYLRASERSAVTIGNYLADLRSFSHWFCKTNGYPPEPENITPTDLREYKGVLLEDYKLKPSTVNRRLTTLRSFLTWAANVGLLVHSRAPTMPHRVRQMRNGPRWLDRRERQALAKAVERTGTPRDQAIIKVLLNTGLRVGEICLLTWQDVTVRPRKGKLIVRQGKGRKYREVPLNREARKALLALGSEDRAATDEPIFTGQRGPLTPRGVHSALQRYFVFAGLDGVSPHCLRHTFCKTLIDAGASLHEVAALVGHESLETTRRYCEPSMKDLEQSVDLLAESV